jgi:hypothetical protein
MISNLTRLTYRFLSASYCLALVLTFFSYFRLGIESLRHPVIRQDSWALVRPLPLSDYPGLISWLFEQHNEHRIVLQRISSVIGENIFGIAPENKTEAQVLNTKKLAELLKKAIG